MWAGIEGKGEQSVPSMSGITKGYLKLQYVTVVDGNLDITPPNTWNRLHLESYHSLASYCTVSST